MKYEFKPSYLISKIRINDADSNEQEKAFATLDSTDKEKLGLSGKRQADILYMEDVLVSEGENKNDDIFLAEELGLAVLKRDTVKGKPVNWEHNSQEIIGFMYDSFLVDAEGTRINKVPEDEKFHVISRSMIWKNISSLHRDRAQAIALAEKDDSLFVSMEANFSRFDYAVGDEIIERNENTAFLDFALRINGGSGEFDGKRVRRVLRDITFAGKAVVEKPANPDSFILSVAKDISKEVIPEVNILGKIKFVSNDLDNVDARCEDIPGSQEPIFASLVLNNIKPKEKISKASEDTVEKTEDKQIGVDRMAENTELQSKLDAANDQIEELNKKLSNADVAKAREEIDGLKIANEKSLETIKDLESKVADSKSLDKDLEKAKEDLAKANSSVEELQEKVTEMEADKSLVDRKAKIEEILKLDEDAMAQELEDVKYMDEEKFNSHLERMKNYVSTVAKVAEDKIAADKAAKEAEKAKANDKTKDDTSIEDAVDNIKLDDSGSINADNKSEDETMQDIFGEHFGGVSSEGDK